MKYFTPVSDTSDGPEAYISQKQVRFVLPTIDISVMVSGPDMNITLDGGVLIRGDKGQAAQLILSRQNSDSPVYLCYQPTDPGCVARVNGIPTPIDPAQLLGGYYLLEITGGLNTIEVDPGTIKVGIPSEIESLFETL